MKDKKTFGNFIKEKRTSKNYSQEDLANLLYVTKSAVSKWERGVSYPDITLITDICRVLEITEKELIQSGDDTEYRKIKKDSDKYNKIKKTLFWILNISYILAVVVCFIVNLAVDKTLSWFFIVLTSVIVGYTFCPTICWIYDKHKKLIFIGSTFLSLFLLFLTCSIYTNNYWFMIPTISVLLGYFIVFYPILFKEQKKYLDENKFKKLSKYFLISYFVGIFLLILILLVFINLYSPFNLLLAVIITGGCMVIPLIFGIVLLFDVSQTIIKILLIAIVGLFVVVILIAIARAIYFKSTLVNKSFIIEEVYDKVSIDIEVEDINIYLSNENKVVFADNKNFILDINVIDNKLIIKRNDSRKFYDKMFIFANDIKLDLYMSKNMIELLDIKSSTGNINIYEGFTFNNVDINNSTGNISVKSDVIQRLSINNSTGNIKIIDANLGATNLKTSTGDIKLQSVNSSKLDISISTGTTRLEDVIVLNDLNINGSTGNVYLDHFDAANIFIELSTGSVMGTILSDKIFIASSDTGNVFVPDTTSGGKCKITVSTGNINIKIKK